MIRRFTVPGAPVGKGRPIITNRGGRPHGFTPAKTRAYERSVAAAYQAKYSCVPPLTGALEVKIEAFMPIPESWKKDEKAQALAEIKLPTVKSDIDNIIKIVFDSLNGIAYEDDKQIVAVRACKKYGATPRVDIEIYSRETDGANSPK